MTKKTKTPPPPVPSTLPPPPNEDGEVLDLDPVAEGLPSFEVQSAAAKDGDEEPAPESAPKPRTVSRTLPVRLKPEEHKLRVKEMTAAIDAHHKAELQLEEEDKRHKAKLKSGQAENDQRKARYRELRRIVDSGVEDRDVECIERRNDVDGSMEVVRLDTEEVVESRPMLPSERQRPLPFDDATPPAGSKTTEWIAGGKVPPPAPPAESEEAPAPAVGVFGKDTGAKHVTSTVKRRTKASGAVEVSDDRGAR